VVLSLIGVIIFAAAVTALSYSLQWSFIITIVGTIIAFVAAMCLCAGMQQPNYD
jgi:hypothetical protein